MILVVEHTCWPIEFDFTVVHAVLSQIIFQLEMKPILGHHIIRLEGVQHSISNRNPDHQLIPRGAAEQQANPGRVQVLPGGQSQVRFEPSMPQVH